MNASLPDHLQTMKVEMIQNLKKFQTGIEPAWPLRRPDATLCPLSYWRAGHLDDHFHFHVFIRSSKYFISYTAIHVSELRDVMKETNSHTKLFFCVLILERLSITFTSNGKRQFVPCDQVFTSHVVLILFIISTPTLVVSHNFYQ